MKMQKSFMKKWVIYPLNRHLENKKRTLTEVNVLFLQSIIHLAKKPSVFVINSLHYVIQAYTNLGSIDRTMQICVHITALV